MMRHSRLVAPVAVMLLAVAAVGSGAALPAPAVAQAPSGLCDSESVAQFGDVGDSDYAAAYILCMRALGLSQGRSDGDFGPDRKLNRGQMASFLIRLWTDHLGGQCPTDVVVPFTDTGGTTHETNIECLFGLGITQGTTATTYGPQDLLKASQISRFLYRTYQEAGGDQCAGTAASELVRASECLFNLRVVPSTDEATSPTPVIRSQMGVYVIGLWHNLTGKGLPPAPPQLGATTPSTTTTTQPVVVREPAAVDGSGIWVVGVDGTGLRQISTGGGSLEWSPDGSRIAYLGSSSDDGLWVVGADGNGLTQVAPDAPGWANRAWSPDGSRIAYVANDGLWVVGADGTGLTQVATDARPRNSGWSPGWSPDSSNIAYIGPGGLWVVGADGANPRQLVSNGWAPVWAPDSSGIAYVANDGLWVVGADGANPEQIVSDGRDPVWSPDGTRIAYIGPGGLWVVGADGANPKQVVSDSARVSPLWSPDSSRIAYYAVLGGVWVVGADGANPKQIESSGWDPAWSSDSSRIAFITNNSADGISYAVWVAGADGANRQLLATITTSVRAPFVAAVAWSPEGSRFAFTGYFVVPNLS